MASEQQPSAQFSLYPEPSLYKISHEQLDNRWNWHATPEWYIHSMIYHLYPNVHAIVHSHSTIASSFTSTTLDRGRIPIKAVLNEAWFLGKHPPPVFEPFNLLHNEDIPSVERSAEIPFNIAQHMASLFLPPEDREFIVSNINSLEVPPNFQYWGHTEELKPVVLVQGEGFLCIGESLEHVVSRAVYTQRNFVALKDALALVGGEPSRVKSVSREEQKIAE